MNQPAQASRNKRNFNVAGPCLPKEHYMIDVFGRGGNEVLDLINEKFYFVIHAARQSGKTTLLWELTDRLNAEGEYYVLYCSLEAVQGIKEPEKGIPEIVNRVKTCIKDQGLPEGFAKDADFSNFSIHGYIFKADYFLTFLENLHSLLGIFFFYGKADIFYAFMSD